MTSTCCDMCGLEMDVVGPARPRHGVFIMVAIGATAEQKGNGVCVTMESDSSIKCGYVGGVCDECVGVARDTAEFFERERRGRGGIPPLPPAVMLESLWARFRRAAAIVIGGAK